MSIKIDEKTVVPIGWVLGGFAVIIMPVIVGAIWVAGVNFRLQRIEQKLGIPVYEAASDGIIVKAFAKERDANTK